MLAGSGLFAFPARAGDLDLDDDPQDAKKDEESKTRPAADEMPMPPAPFATIRPHAYSLPECLALAERNHPNLWAARARLAGVHAQLDEAKYTPYSFWSANSTFGVLPRLGGITLSQHVYEIDKQGIVGEKK